MWREVKTHVLVTEMETKDHVSHMPREGRVLEQKPGLMAALQAQVWGAMLILTPDPYMCSVSPSHDLM